MKFFVLFMIGQLFVSGVVFADEDLLEVNKKLHKSARDLGKKLFPLIIKQDIEGIRETYVSAEDVKSWVIEGAFDMERSIRDYQLTKKGANPEEMKEMLKDPKLHKQVEKMRRDRADKRWGRLFESAKKDGVDLAKAVYVDSEIAELYIRSKEAYSLAADINIVVKFQGKLWVIQLDDCALSKQGWVLVDGVRWLKYGEE